MMISIMYVCVSLKRSVSIIHAHAYTIAADTRVFKIYVFETRYVHNSPHAYNVGAGTCHTKEFACMMSLLTLVLHNTHS